MGVTDEPDIDPDQDTAPGDLAAPPAHRRPALLVVILVGGTLGTFVRASLEAAVPAGVDAVPWMTLSINVCGSLLLGLLLETLTRAGPDTGWRRSARLGLGTGVLGGFTTYSTFAVETTQRLSAGSVSVGLGYSLVSVVLGIVAAAAGLWLGRRVRTHDSARQGQR